MGIRSLYSGVSGLRNFQQQLDLIGNNIANSQTSGYKSTRMTFQDLLSQTERGATSASASQGGVNPVQFGLGASIGAIDTDFTQGNLLTTGRNLDLAISGNGFFKVSSGSDSFYTRAGAFDIDEAGNLVSTTSGYIAQGYNATQGVLDLTQVTGIQVPVGVILPAQATESVSLVGNLNSTDQQVATLLDSQTLLTTEQAGDDSDIDGLFAVGTLNARIAGMQPSVTTVSINSTDGAGTVSAFSVTYVTNDSAAGNAQFNSIEDLVQELNAQLTADGSLFSITQATDGALDITMAAGAGNGSLSITSTNASLSSALSGGTSAAYLAAGTTTRSTDEFTHATVDTDLLTRLRNSSGTALGLTAGDAITISAEIGGEAQSGTHTVTALDTFSNLNTSVKSALLIQQNDAVSMNNGKIRITGDGGTDYGIENFSLSTSGVRANFDSYLDDTTGNWISSQRAQDNHVTSFIAHDSDGVQHTITMKFNIRESSSGQINWVWDAHSVETSTGTDEVFPLVSPTATNQSGSLAFNNDGSLSSFSPTSITIQPNGTAQNITVTLDMGTTGAYDGMVSFENDSSARFSDITGYASGELQNISINSDGIVLGNFSNGQNQTLAQMVISMFDNPSGLEKVGGNMYQETLNSGTAVDGLAGNAGRGVLVPSTLEASNVDLAREFVTLITAQRGFQTNARIITASNDLLGELVNLVR